jgi:diacylglycerol kinase (ATP)
VSETEKRRNGETEKGGARIDSPTLTVSHHQSPIPARLIVNPVSGKGRGVTVAEQARRLLREHGLEPEVVYSRSSSEPTAFARAAVRDGCPLVIGVGGDGLINQVANELVGSDVALGIIPAGVGNDLARGLGIPLDLAGACRVIAQGATRTIDVAQAGERYFFSVAVLGFGAEVNRRANQFRRFRVNAVYTFLTITTMFSYEPLTFTVNYDGYERRCVSWMMAVGNTWSSARGMALVPAARPDDGLLHACIINGMGRWELLYTFPRVFKGRHIYHTGIDTIRGREISVSAEGPCDIYADGEYFGSLPVVLKAVPQALKVMLPKRG